MLPKLKEYKTSSKEDYVLLILNRDTSIYTGCYDVQLYRKNALKGKLASTYGYPVNKTDKPKMNIWCGIWKVL